MIFVIFNGWTKELVEKNVYVASPWDLTDLLFYLKSRRELLIKLGKNSKELVNQRMTNQFHAIKYYILLRI